ncbi:MAG: HD domain-containing phosphohydrolase [Lysobacteraceae bacterium]
MSRTHETRIDVAGLTVGMYVSRLDRPWLGTAFPLEGLSVRNEDEVKRLQSLCHYVFVDPLRGESPHPRYLQYVDPSPALVQRATGQDELASLRKTTWVKTAEFDAELPQAQKAHGQLERGIEEVMVDLRNGGGIDLEKLREGVSAMLDSITRNPAAFIWLKAIKRTSDYAYQHALGCSVWAASFGRQLGMNRNELDELALTGLLFDVGKTRLPESLLTRADLYNENDRTIMRDHVQIGVDMLSSTEGLPKRVVTAVATHHERHDGSGYPQGLIGSEIPIFGRITGLIDCYDAMTSVQPHAGSLSPHQSVMQLYEARDTLFQSELVEQFIQTCGIYPSGSLVELSDGRVGVVTAVHDLKRLRPSVMLLLDAGKSPLREFRSLDLSELHDQQGDEAITIRRGLPQGAYGVDPAELFLD